MSKTNIPVQELEFDQIKTNLKTFLKGQSQFQDYDFEGSSMSIHMDLLAYVTHYMGFYGHMLNNESNIDSANLKSSMNSKAKFQNYVPGSKKSAEATVKITVGVNNTNEPTDRKIVIPRGESIKSSNNSTDSRTLVLVDDLYIYNKSLLGGTYDYTSEETLVYEGSFEKERFIADESLLNQRFIIRDKDIDLSSLRVRVFDSENDSNFITFKRVNDYMVVNKDSAVFFVTVNEDDYYEIQFGNGVYGQPVQTGNMIECTFVSSSGEEGNNSKSFTYSGDFYYGGTPYTLAVEAITSSEGGMDGEDVEDLRFNIPYHYRRQNRAVIIDDYKNLLLSEYRNINSINVWGGEDNIPKEYGKVFICIKPKFGEVLSSKAKENILNNIVKRRNVTVIEADIVDPDFLYVNLDIFIQYNPLNTEKSTGEIRSDAQIAVDTYNDVKLNRFGSFYSNLDLNNTVKASNRAILTSYTKIILEKRFVPLTNSKQTYAIDFLNPLIAGTVKSDEFTFRLSRCYFADDDSGNIRIWFYNEAKSAFEMYPDEVFGLMDYTNGIVRLIDFEINGLYGANTKLGVYAKPENPDFFTKRNNIVVIDDTVIQATINHENENEK